MLRTMLCLFWLIAMTACTALPIKTTPGPVAAVTPTMITPAEKLTLVEFFAGT